MSAERFGDRATLVITDYQWDQLHDGQAMRFGNDCVILTVPNGASIAQREAMAVLAADIRHGRTITTPATSGAGPATDPQRGPDVGAASGQVSTGEA